MTMIYDVPYRVAYRIRDEFALHGELVYYIKIENG